MTLVTLLALVGVGISHAAFTTSVFGMLSQHLVAFWLVLLGTATWVYGLTNPPVREKIIGGALQVAGGFALLLLPSLRPHQYTVAVMFAAVGVAWIWLNHAGAKN